VSRDDQKRAIGKVVSVAADRFVVEMHAGTDNFTVVGFDDVHYVARLGSFLMIPIHTEYVVAEVVGLRERDASSPDRNPADLSKAASAKFLDVVPVGMLPKHKKDKFRFGVSTFPSLYADALYALDAELDRIFETEPPEKIADVDDLPEPNPINATRFKSLHIGDSVVFDGYQVKVKIDDFFGGHSAILGNTGSGKSCTVATILQSLFSKPDEYKARGATFVVFDVNGEYTQAFSELKNEGITVKSLTLDGTAGEGKFRLPHWFLELAEWELLLQASERTQMPILRQGLGFTSMNALAPRVKRHFVASCVLECFRGADGDSPVAKIQRVWSLLDKYGDDTLNRDTLLQLGCNQQYGNFVPHTNQTVFLEQVKAHLIPEVTLPAFSGSPFSFTMLEECLDFALLYEEAHGNRQIRDYCSQMLTRFKSLRDRAEYEFLRHEITAGEAQVSPNQFLKDLLGLADDGERLVKAHQVVVLDMNGVDDEVVELVSSVLARMIFQHLRKADPRNRFPVHLVLEEAHRYIAERPSRYSIDASRIFERIAKEGRKYGMFLCVASQRPSELSKTVLSQCANFVVHRIQNPDDLTHIRQMTPFISEAVLKRLPSLPKQHALVFGTSVNLPTTFKVREAKPLPLSDDTKICDLWFRKENDPIEIRLPADPLPTGAEGDPPPLEPLDVAGDEEEEDDIPF
jgi:uncharacterized protein